MSSIGRNGNRYNGLRSVLNTVTTASTSTQEQLKAVVLSTTDQQKSVNKRMEDMETLVQILRGEVQALKMEFQSQKADTQGNKLDVVTQKADVQQLKADIAVLQGQVKALTK
jgi:predicted  nucleic acid-binding Zn-ribbon protein